jgi:hypothetical protein
LAAALHKRNRSGGSKGSPIAFGTAGNGYQGAKAKPGGNILVAWLQQINMNLN